VVWLLLASAARAQDGAAPIPATQDTVKTADRPAEDVRPFSQRPISYVLRSSLVPGWGQWANHRHWKAVGVAAGQGYLAYRAIHAGQVERDWRDKARADSIDVELELRRARYQADRRHDFTWWSVFALIFSLGDAYVDAALGDFRGQFQPQNAAASTGRCRRESSPIVRPFAGLEMTGRDRGVLRLGLRVRVP